MDHNRFWDLLAKKLSGETSEEELQELESFMKAYPELTYAAQHITDLWKLKQPENKAAAEKAFQKHITKIKEQPKSFPPSETMAAENESAPFFHARKNRKVVGLVVMAILVFTAGLFVWNASTESVISKRDKQTAEIYTRPGTRTKVVLPDSSVVWLNAGSKLTYSEPFGVTERTVTLTGEAFFDVVKNSKLFIIQTSGVQIKVLGTAFNVRNYPNEKKIETSLVRGSVEITLDKSPEKKYVLKPNEKLTLNTEENVEINNKKRERLPLAIVSTLHYLNSNTIAETSWIENKLVFADESFEDVAKKMERWYGVSIRFKNEKVKVERFTGVFEKETVWQALEALQLTAAFHFTMKDTSITITH
jgi:ferric-dicitrate binding protein FerR (iron transport regulator)